MLHLFSFYLTLHSFSDVISSHSSLLLRCSALSFLVSFHVSSLLFSHLFSNFSFYPLFSFHLMSPLSLICVIFCCISAQRNSKTEIRNKHDFLIQHCACRRLQRRDHHPPLVWTEPLIRAAPSLNILCGSGLGYKSLSEQDMLAVWDDSWVMHEICASGAKLICRF